MDTTFSDSSFSKNFLLGQELVKRGFINSEQLDEALIYQVRKNIRLGEALVELGYVREVDIDKVIAAQFGIEYIELDGFELDEELVNKLPQGSVKKYSILPISFDENVLKVCMPDPLDSKLQKFLKEHVSVDFKLAVATRSSIEACIDKFYY